MPARRRGVHPHRRRWVPIRSRRRGCRVDDVVPAAGHDHRVDAHEIRLVPREPREQREILGVEDLLHPFDRTGLTLHHDAPCGSIARLIPVDLERHETIEYRTRELGAGGAAEHDAAVIGDEVDREDVGLAGDVDSEPTDVGLAEQFPTLRLTEDLGGLLSLVHATIQHDPGMGSKSRTSSVACPVFDPLPVCVTVLLGWSNCSVTQTVGRCGRPCWPTGDGRVRTGAAPRR